MSLPNILLVTAEFAAIIPLMLMCFAPVKDKCKIKNRAFLPVTIGVLFVLCVLCSVIKLSFSIRTSFLFIPLLIVCLALYLIAFDTNKLKLLYIYTTSFTVLTFASTSAVITEASFKSTASRGDVLSIGLVVEWCIVGVFFPTFFVCLKKIKWLINDYHLSSVWKGIWIVPASIAFANIVMMPDNYENVNIGDAVAIFTVVTLLLAFLFVLFQVLIYAIAKIITDKANTEKQSQILGAQATQYKELKSYIENTSRLRHDFLHTARTALKLAENGDNENLVKLLKDYGVSIEKSHTKILFCEHDSLNAIVSYYYDECVKNDIKCDFEVSIPNSIAIKSDELCSVVGNILNNAMEANLFVEKDRRYISFKADVEINNDIYIVASNSFDGNIKKDNGKYKTTKASGHGIGLESIKATVYKHNGYLKFYNDNDNFYTDIMMRTDLTSQQI